MSKTKYESYSEEFKWKVVQEVLEGRLSKTEAMRVYGIKSKCAILYWMRKFSGIDNYRDSGSVPLDQRQTMAASKQELELRRRILELEQEVKRERQRADLWQKMIEIAEQELCIDIKKKSGIQQSKDIKQSKTDL